MTPRKRKVLQIIALLAELAYIEEDEFAEIERLIINLADTRIALEAEEKALELSRHPIPAGLDSALNDIYDANLEIRSGTIEESLKIIYELLRKTK